MTSVPMSFLSFPTTYSSSHQHLLSYPPLDIFTLEPKPFNTSSISNGRYKGGKRRGMCGGEEGRWFSDKKCTDRPRDTRVQCYLWFQGNDFMTDYELSTHLPRTPNPDTSLRTPGECIYLSSPLSKPGQSHPNLHPPQRTTLIPSSWIFEFTILKSGYVRSFSRQKLGKFRVLHLITDFRVLSNDVDPPFLVNQPC